MRSMKVFLTTKAVCRLVLPLQYHGTVLQLCQSEDQHLDIHAGV